MLMATRFMDWIGLVSPTKIFMCSPLSFTFQLSQHFLYVCARTCYLDSLTIDKPKAISIDQLWTNISVCKWLCSKGCSIPNGTRKGKIQRTLLTHKSLIQFPSKGINLRQQKFPKSNLGIDILTSNRIMECQNGYNIPNLHILIIRL
jgi:hypothetical protein